MFKGLWGKIMYLAIGILSAAWWSDVFTLSDLTTFPVNDGWVYAHLLLWPLFMIFKFLIWFVTIGVVWMIGLIVVCVVLLFAYKKYSDYKWRKKIEARKASVGIRK